MDSFRRAPSSDRRSVPRRSRFAFSTARCRPLLIWRSIRPSRRFCGSWAATTSRDRRDGCRRRSRRASRTAPAIPSERGRGLAAAHSGIGIARQPCIDVGCERNCFRVGDPVIGWTGAGAGARGERSRSDVFQFAGRRAPGGPNPLTFFNAFSEQPGLISPTEVLAIYGAGLAPGLQGCSTGSQLFGPLPLSLATVQVQFSSDGYRAFAPLYSVCNMGPGQEYVRVQAPADLPLTATTVTIQVGGAIVAQSLIAAVPASPGILETAMSDGVKRAALLRLDGSYVSLESPVQRGERLRAFVTGLGRPVTSSGVLINTNQAGTFGDDAAPPNPVTVRIADRSIDPVSSVYSAESIGVYVVTFDVPDDIQSGADVDFAVATLLGDQNVLGKLSKLPVQ